MSFRRALCGLVVGVVITMPLLWIAMTMGRPGARALFPYAMWSTDFPKRGATFSLVASLVQFPIYGAVLGAFYFSPRFRLVAALLILLHIIAALILPAIPA